MSRRPPRRLPLLVGLAAALSCAPGPRPATTCPPGTSLQREETEAECVTVEGLWHGPRWVYDSEGRLRAYGTGRRGASDGAWWNFHPDGRPSDLTTFEAGTPSGLHRQWYSDGTLRVEGRYDSRGQMHGRWRRFGPGGALRQEWSMEHGRPEGATRAWHANGALRARGHRQEGRPHGVWTWWTPEGEIRARCIYAHGRVVEGRCLPPPGLHD